MARKKYLDESNDEGQENLLLQAQQQQQQQHQHNIKKSILGPSSGSGGHGLGIGSHLNLNPQHHSQHGMGGKNTNKTLPKTSEESFFSVLKQLSNTGLTIREMPGDGYVTYTDTYLEL
jgi:hypothetical protein